MVALYINWAFPKQVAHPVLAVASQQSQVAKMTQDPLEALQRLVEPSEGIVVAYPFHHQRGQEGVGLVGTRQGF